MNLQGAPPKVLERARKARWANKSAEQRTFQSQYANACLKAKRHGDSLERCILVQETLRCQLRRGFETDDLDRYFQASTQLLAWEKVRMVREQMEPKSVQPTPEEPSETVLSGVDQEELERLASQVPGYRGGNQGHHPPSQKPYKQRTLGMVTGVAEQDQKEAARRKEQAQITANQRPLHEEEEE